MVSNSSNSTSTSITIIIIIKISSSITNKISVLLTVSTSFSELFKCFLLFYINITHHHFLRGLNGNNLTKLFCAILAIAAYRDVFYQSFQFNEFMFVYVVNVMIRFIFDGKIYLLNHAVSLSAY